MTASSFPYYWQRGYEAGQRRIVDDWMPGKPKHLLNVPNNILGRTLLRIIRHYANKNQWRVVGEVKLSWRLIPRGRTPKVKGLRGAFRYDTPRKYAKRLAIYVVPRERRG